MDAAEKRQRKINRLHQHLKTLTIGSVFNKHPNGIACLFQKLVRLQAADDNGMVTCYTCDYVDHYSRMNGSHFVGRNNKATVIDENNVRACCVNCNQWDTAKHHAAFRVRLIEEIGLKSVEELETRRLPNNHVWNRYELAEIKYDLLEEIKLHEKRLADD